MDAINAEWAIDSIVDETNLLHESTKTPKLHHKYYTMYIPQHLRTLKLKADMKELKKAKMIYYKGEMDEFELKKWGWKPNPLKILRGDIDNYMEGDIDYIQLGLKIGYNEAATKYLTDIINTLNGRSFIIKNAIDDNKFKNGVV